MSTKLLFPIRVPSTGKRTGPDMDKRTVSRMDAALERTGMYSQRVRVPCPGRYTHLGHLFRMLHITLMLLISVPGLAQQTDHPAEHGGQFYHRFLLEAGTGIDNDGHHMTDGELDGWIGTDENRLRIDAGGLYSGGSVEAAELRLLYSRKVSTYWDAQIGIHQDIRPESTRWLVFGMEGLAPYFFETDLHALVNTAGDISIRLRQENDLLITQRLILQPLLEAELNLQDMPEQQTGSGLSRATLGLQLRYEFTRKVSVYTETQYERTFGKTATYTGDRGIDRDSLWAGLGLRLMF